MNFDFDTFYLCVQGTYLNPQDPSFLICKVRWIVFIIHRVVIKIIKSNDICKMISADLIHIMHSIILIFIITATWNTWRKSRWKLPVTCDENIFCMFLTQNSKQRWESLLAFLVQPHCATPRKLSEVVNSRLYEKWPLLQTSMALICIY